MKCTVHLCNREYKVADLAKMADTRGVNMKDSLFKKEMKKVSERPVIQRNRKSEQKKPSLYFQCWGACLKAHKHEIILNFFLPKSNSYMPFVNFRKKIRFFSFDFCQNFDVRTFPRLLSIRGTKLLLRDIQTIFFQNLHFGPIR